MEERGGVGGGAYVRLQPVNQSHKLANGQKNNMLEREIISYFLLYIIDLFFLRFTWF